MKSDPTINDDDRRLLQEILDHYRQEPALPEVKLFRAQHAGDRQHLAQVEDLGLLMPRLGRYYLTLAGLRACGSEEAKTAYERCGEIVSELRRAYTEAPGQKWNARDFGERFRWSAGEVSRILTLLIELPEGSFYNVAPDTGFVVDFDIHESILDAELPPWGDGPEQAETGEGGPQEQRIQTIEINGYRPFSGFSAGLDQLMVIIGANATGKSSLFDLLRFLAFAVENALPPEIDPRNAGRTLFYAGGPERIDLAVTADIGQEKPLRYEVSIQGPLGAPRVVRERLATTEPLREGEHEPFLFLDFRSGKGVVRRPRMQGIGPPTWSVASNELALRRALDPTLVTLSHFQRFVASWRFYSGFDVSPTAALRRPAQIEEDPVLSEDGSNLSAVLNSLLLEHREAWEELETYLGAAVPGFEKLGVKPRAKGMAIGVWREQGVNGELTLADLSDGTLRLLCWLALALSPLPPPLICIDEPETGLHPSVLPVLAGAFKIASARSQILIATHSPHFLSQFTLDDIAVMRKEDGRAVFVRPSSSAVLRSEVEEIGGDALAKLFLSEELEVLP